MDAERYCGNCGGRVAGDTCERCPASVTPRVVEFRPPAGPPPAPVPAPKPVADEPVRLAVPEPSADEVVDRLLQESRQSGTDPATDEAEVYPVGALPVLLTVEQRVARRAGLANNEVVTVTLPCGKQATALVAVV